VFLCFVREVLVFFSLLFFVGEVVVGDVVYAERNEISRVPIQEPVLPLL